MPSKPPAPRAAVARYYEGRVREFGATPWGVDWTCALTQQLRFVQLMKVAGRRRRFSLNDLGCGYAALLPFVRERYGDRVDYAGVDVAPTMIGQARSLWGGDAAARFDEGCTLPRVADYSVASGVFNVQLGFGARAWTSFVKDVLLELRRSSRRGFAVNFIEPPRRGVEPLQGLYRTDPAPWVEHCSRAFGAQVKVIEDYGLREFTLLVQVPE